MYPVVEMCISINRYILSILEHALCKDQNGQCSKLCLPRGTNQRSCNCRDGVNLKDDGRTCVGGMSHNIHLFIDCSFFM